MSLDSIRQHLFPQLLMITPKLLDYVSPMCTCAGAGIYCSFHAPLTKYFNNNFCETDGLIEFV